MGEYSNITTMSGDCVDTYSNHTSGDMVMMIMVMMMMVVIMMVE